MEGTVDAGQDISAADVSSVESHGSLLVVTSSGVSPSDSAEAEAARMEDQPGTGLAALYAGKKRRGQKPPMTVRPGEVVVGGVSIAPDRANT